MGDSRDVKLIVCVFVRFAVGKCVKILVLGMWAGKDNVDKLHQAELDHLDNALRREGKKYRRWDFLSVGCAELAGSKHFTSHGARTILKTHKKELGRFFSSGSIYK